MLTNLSVYPSVHLFFCPYLPLSVNFEVVLGFSHGIIILIESPRIIPKFNESGISGVTEDALARMRRQGVDAVQIFVEDVGIVGRIGEDPIDDGIDRADDKVGTKELTTRDLKQNKRGLFD